MHITVHTVVADANRSSSTFELPIVGEGDYTVPVGFTLPIRGGPPTQQATLAQHAQTADPAPQAQSSNWAEPADGMSLEDVLAQHNCLDLRNRHLYNLNGIDGYRQGQLGFIIVFPHQDTPWYDEEPPIRVSRELQLLGLQQWPHVPEQVWLNYEPLPLRNDNYYIVESQDLPVSAVQVYLPIQDTNWYEDAGIQYIDRLELYCPGHDEVRQMLVDRDLGRQRTQYLAGRVWVAIRFIR